MTKNSKIYLQFGFLEKVKPVGSKSKYLPLQNSYFLTVKLTIMGFKKKLGSTNMLVKVENRQVK